MNKIELNETYYTRNKMYWYSNNPYEVEGKKICSKCGEEKGRDMFGMALGNKDGLCTQCKVCRVSSNNYYKTRIQTAHIRLRHRNKYLGHEDILENIDEFINWYNKTTKKCYYCLIPEDKIKILDWGNVTSYLTFDRVDNNKGYSINNMCLACKVCNVAKGDVFSSEEFISLALNYIKPKWQKLLANYKK